ncbi:rhodanese-like domain-containing protein [Shewanella psychrotolerans]|uniref:rhodanese-like domain-containing protein n=1 Tax=Shewanella psychrotolerans TaxID=2864206 RepID=UPI001C656664|nr:rhodanese-like domain-containing protein [Shewanella psychrotolerans]QYK02681.1 rhodanese-like domain-containing protein [Shewanella psychrotolerans]
MEKSTYTLVKQFNTLIALLFLAVVSLSAPSVAAETDAQTTAWKMINNGALIIDVRTPEEFHQGHLDNAVNIPYESISTEFTKRKIAKDQPVVVYCRSGRRSSIAQSSLIELGYSNIHNGGGYEQLAGQK